MQEIVGPDDLEGAILEDVGRLDVRDSIDVNSGELLLAGGFGDALAARTRVSQPQARKGDVFIGEEQVELVVNGLDSQELAEPFDIARSKIASGFAVGRALSVGLRISIIPAYRLRCMWRRR